MVLQPDGGLDNSAGDRGVIAYDPVGESTSHFYGLAVSADGKRLVATTSNHANGVLVAVLEITE